MEAAQAEIGGDGGSGSVNVQSGGEQRLGLGTQGVQQQQQGQCRRKASRADDVQWGEVATNFFIDAFEERYVEINKGNFRGKDWENLAAVVSSRFAEEGKSFSAFQCKHKLENLKKKYRREKAAMQATGTMCSVWQWYNRMDHLFGHAPTKASGIAGAVDNGEREEGGGEMMDRLTDALDLEQPQQCEGVKLSSPLQPQPETSAGSPNPEAPASVVGKRMMKKRKRRSSMYSPAKDLAASFREYAHTMAEVEREKIQILRALLAHHNIIIQPPSNNADSLTD